jgi:iron complex outermembrane receptor protein
MSNPMPSFAPGSPLAKDSQCRHRRSHFPSISSGFRFQISGFLRHGAALAFLFTAAALPAQVAKKSTAELKRLDLEDLMQVQITSLSGYAENLRDAPSSIQVISTPEIARATAVTLSETLRLANNLNVAQKNPHDWAVSARGFNANLGNKMLVLMDGRSVYTPLFSGVFWSSQDYVLEDVDRIEVISGPGGTLWGANAVNGVINVTTKSAADTQGLLVQAATGNELEGALTVRYGGKASNDTYYRVYAKTFAVDDAILASGDRAHDRWNQVQAGFRVDSKRSETDTLTVQGDVYSGDLDIQAGETGDLSGGNLLARWARQAGDGSETSLQTYFDRTNLTDPFAASALAPAGFIKDTLDTWDIQLRHSRHLGERHRLSAGLGYRHIRDHVRQAAPNLTFLPMRVDQDLPSAFLQDEFQFDPRFAVTIGSKIEHNTYTGFEYEPTIRFQWKPSEEQTWWAAASRAVRMPSRYDRDAYEPAPPVALLQGGPTFRSETLVSYEAGFRQGWGALLSTSVTVFRHTYDHLRTWHATPVTLIPVTFTNDMEATSDGVEFNADFKVTSAWRLNAGYNYLDTDLRLKPGGSDFFNLLDETADPRHQAALRSYLDLPRGWQFDLGLRWVDELIVNNNRAPGTVPAYAELDARLAWQATPALEVALLGRNLLHASHPEFGPPGPGREEIQRSVFVKVTWKR